MYLVVLLLGRVIPLGNRHVQSRCVPGCQQPCSLFYTRLQYQTGWVVRGWPLGVALYDAGVGVTRCVPDGIG